MENKKIEVYFGDGRGKTSAAIGNAIQKAGKGKSVIMIQFLKEKEGAVNEFIRRLEPEMKVFRFQKSERFFDDLSKQQQADEIANILNGVNYAKKVLSTEECNILILDEVLALVDRNIISIKELIDILERVDEDVEMILTGRNFRKELLPYVNVVYEIAQKYPSENESYT